MAEKPASTPETGRRAPPRTIRPKLLIAADYLLDSLRAASRTLRRCPSDDPERTAKVATAIAKGLREASALAEIARAAAATAEGSHAAKIPVADQDEATTREILGRLARRAEALRAAELREGADAGGAADAGG